jgi:hypothetical protein
MAYKKKVVYDYITDNIYLAEVDETGKSNTKPKENITDWVIRLVASKMKNECIGYKVNFDDGDYKLELTKIEDKGVNKNELAL